METKSKKSQDSYYPFVLDTSPGFFLDMFFSRLFKHIKFDKIVAEELKRMSRDGTVVYACKYKSHLDYLLLHYLFRKSRLPFPGIAFALNMSLVLPLSRLFRVIKFYLSYFFKHGSLPNPFSTGFYKKAIRDGVSSHVCLVDPEDFTRHFVHAEDDHIHFLIETQMSMDRPIFIVPQLILYKVAPEKDNPNFFDILFGFNEKPGLIRKIGLFLRYHRKAFIDFGRPLNLKDYLEAQPSNRSAEDMAYEVRQMLIESIDNQKRVVLGPVMKSRQQLKELVLKEDDVIKSISKIGDGSPRKLKQTRKKADEYFDEIAADFNITYVQFFDIALTWLWKKIFEGVDVDEEGLALVRKSARSCPVVYVPSHKSHVDYLVLNHLLYRHHMHVPRVAAGKNLSFWPMGYIFRKSGAFFVRRTFKGARLYLEVFSSYIKILLKEGHPLEFFIEGGRSRSGKLILPKIGFLSILLKAYRDGYCENLMFIPTSIIYDRVLEEKSYLKEIGGGEKEKESFRQVLKTRQLLKRKYGKIYIRFGRPISLRRYLEREKEHGLSVQKKLANCLVRSINRVTMITPLALVAIAILTKHRRGFYMHELLSTAETIIAFLKKYEIPMATTLVDFEKAVQDTIALLINWKMINFLEDVDGAETFYYVDEEKKAKLEYYKNSIIHWFISHAFVAVSLLTGTEEVKTGAEIIADYGFLKNLFKNEFAFEEEKEDREEIEKILSYFLDASFISYNHTDDGYKLARLGFDKLIIWAALTKTFLESYWIVAQTLIRRKEKEKQKGDILKIMNTQGQQFYKLGLIDHMEAISKISFENAERFINKNILRGRNISEEKRKKAWDNLSRLSRRLYKFSHYRTLD